MSVEGRGECGGEEEEGRVSEEVQERRERDE